jgi:hypothetical protein
MPAQAMHGGARPPPFSMLTQCDSDATDSDSSHMPAHTCWPMQPCRASRGKAYLSLAGGLSAGLGLSQHIGDRVAATTADSTCQGRSKGLGLATTTGQGLREGRRHGALRYACQKYIKWALSQHGPMLQESPKKLSCKSWLHGAWHIVHSANHVDLQGTKSDAVLVLPKNQGKKSHQCNHCMICLCRAVSLGSLPQQQPVLPPVTCHHQSWSAQGPVPVPGSHHPCFCRRQQQRQ